MICALRRRVWSLVSVILLSLLSACSSQPATVYEGLGGEPGLAAVVDNLLERMAKDEQIVRHFQDTDIALFRVGLNEHLCDVADGPCEYGGEGMNATHRGLNITQADFDRLVQLLIYAMQEEDIPIGVRNNLLKRLAPMYGDVVYQ
jgi:hemoglobin